MILDGPARYYETLAAWWRRPGVSRRLYFGIMLFFVGSALLFACNRAGLLPDIMAENLPRSPYQAIRLAFTLILAVEVVQLILAVAESVALAVAKQLEIMSLLMLRDAFTDITLLHHPIDIRADALIMVQVAAVAGSGLLLFLFRALFLKVRYVQSYRTGTAGYIRAKKGLALFLFAGAGGIGLYDLYGILALRHTSMFFETFYTVLVFADILLLLIGQCFMPSFHVTFRNSGYAVGALLMRIALGAPHYVGAALCVAAGLYVLTVAWATARFLPFTEDDIA